MTTRDLGEKLTETQDDGVLIIDTRPPMIFNASHIKQAHNVHWPPIVKRRSGNHMNLENIIRCPHTRAKLAAGLFHTIVAYDERSISLSSVPKDANLILVLQSLEKQATKVKNLRFLEGGFEQFRYEHLHLCTSASSSLPSDDVNLASISGHGYLSVPASLPNKQHHPILDQGDPVQLLPWLYLGSAWHSRQLSILSRLEVTALLNVSSNEPTPPPPFAVKSKRIPVDDTCTSDISCWFADAVKFIDRVHSEGGKVLVHCLAGISRSATICLAYLMKQRKYTLDQAFDYLKARREIISPNLNFMRQLQEYETALKREPSTPLASPPSSAPVGSHSAPNTPRAKRRALSLQLTPCTQQAAFVFDIPSISSSNSPSGSFTHSPTLVESPS
ncbi:DgyrCDS5412 [Dimorphilus gyrociliatus]|uniref:protein-tyrosine-phosphatase n=1 Tax=Dimorphilus gyrociliatus TaxID=2664684 RepID=A0A7I8VKH5_9ANNE|nr:DgyrCDS5412 [Dimorphilus gyrociliatus]